MTSIVCVSWLSKLAFLVVCFIGLYADGLAQHYGCLPKGINEDSSIRVSVRSKGGSEESPTVLVRDELKKRGARCRQGKLVGSRGRTIVFYQRQGCWGNPPADYREILARQDKELANLKRQNIVIEMNCDPAASL